MLLGTGRTLSFEYDNLLRISKKNVSGVYQHRRNYLGTGTANRQSNLIQYYVFAGADGNGTKMTYRYEYDKAGNINEVYRQITTGSLDFLSSFEYDRLGQLTKAQDSREIETFTCYMTTQQGDITRIEDVNGNVLATYEYDAWGRLISSSGSLAEINPLRYRGYYYDTETGFYYLQSRYYDPVVSRFINADRYASTGTGLLSYNMFAYCQNNPVNYSDPSGEAVNSRTMLINDGGSSSILVGGALSGIKAGVDAINRGNSSSSTNTSSPNSPSSFDYWGDKVAQSSWAIVTSITLDAGVGAGIYGSVNILGMEASLGGFHDPIALHYSYDERISLGTYWEVSGTLGIPGFSAGPKTSRFVPWIGEADSSLPDRMTSGFARVSAGFYPLLGGRFSVRFDTDRIITKIIEIWTE